MKDLIITKASGKQVSFSTGKLRSSLKKSGAAEPVIEEVLRQLVPLLHDGISTKVIYKNAFAILKKLSKPTAARYSLKKGIMQLGPTGFPFEKLIAALLQVQGYATKIGEFVNGHCITHEIDVIAFKDGKRFMIECKYHNDDGVKSNVKIPMYIQSRFKDVEKIQDSDQEYEIRFHQGWVVTNTRFTEDAIRYASCMNLHLVGWDYPSKKGLKDMVDASGLYPVTCLTTLTKAEKQNLLELNVVLCKELLHNKGLLHKAGIKDSRAISVMNEITELCGA